MSLSSKLSKRRLFMSLLAILAYRLSSLPAFSQSDTNPKWDLFVGYQVAASRRYRTCGVRQFQQPYALPDS